MTTGQEQPLIIIRATITDDTVIFRVLLLPSCLEGPGHASIALLAQFRKVPASHAGRSDSAHHVVKLDLSSVDLLLQVLGVFEFAVADGI